MKKFKKKNFKVVSFVCLFFLLCSLCFVFAFTSSTTTTETSISSTPSFSLYCVSTAKSQLESEAITLGKDIMKSGGGGYVWKKGNYFYVISSAYENKNDASLVSASLDSNKISNEVFEIKFEAVNLSSPIQSQEAKNTFNAGVNLFLSTYKELFDISICVDTKIYDETKAFLEINRVQARADEVMKNFHLIFGETQSSISIFLEDAILDANKTIGLLSENQKITEKQTLVSQIRYCYTKICAIYANFLEKIN